MLTADQQRAENRMNPAQALRIELIAGAFFILAIGAFVALAFSIMSYFQALAPDLPQGQIAWDFIQTFGILRPVLVIFAGVMLFRLALRLHARHIGAARWAQTVLMWLLVVVGVAIAQSFSAGQSTVPLIGTPEVSPFLWGISNAFPWLLAGMFISGVFLLLSRSRHLYIGDEDTRQISARAAWNLLTPTIIIFLVIAITPLEQVFITSLTDARFASSDVPEYIGLENYAELLSFRFDSLPCTRSEDGSCLTEVDGDGKTVTVFPRARDTLDEGYRNARYRELNTIDLGETRFVFSARDREWVDSFITSVIYTFFAISLQLILGLFIAMILASKLRGLGIMRLAMLIPLAIPTLIATQFWDVMFLEDRSGVFNSILLSLDLIQRPQPWLLNFDTQLPAVILVIVWKETPTMALLLLPGLISISPEIYQAAKVDGANLVQRFFRITLPMMRATIGVALVLRTMVTFRVFDVFDILLGDAGRFSVATYSFENLILRQQLGYSSAISVTIFAIILVFTIIYVRTLRIDEG